MSKSTKHIWNCIHCGHPQEITIWQSVNVSLSPGLKGKLLNGDLMRVRCVRCGTETELAYALLYHDQDRRFMVWYVVPTRDGIITIGDDMAGIAEALGQRAYKLRIVTSFRSLFEKIRIFDDGLDDRVVEMLKTVLWQEGRCRTYLPRESLVYTVAQYRRGRYHTITMEQTIPEGTTEKVEIGWEDGYLRMADVMERKFRVPRTETARWRIVDHHYWTEISTRRPDYRIRRP